MPEANIMEAAGERKTERRTKWQLKFLRKTTQTVDKFEVGDQITVAFPDRKYTATAIQLVGDGKTALTLLDDFLDEPYYMDRKGGTEGGYEASDVRKHLQEIAEQLPEDFKAKLIPFENGDLMRLLTLTEMTGEDETGTKQTDRSSG